MLLSEETFVDKPRTGRGGLLAHFRRSCARRFPEDSAAVRFVIVSSDSDGYQCEVGVMTGHMASVGQSFSSIFEFRRRLVENTRQFNAVLLVPTGVGAEIGGHAGDAGPVARMLAEVCDFRRPASERSQRVGYKRNS